MLREKLRKSHSSIKIEVLGERKHQEVPEIIRDSSALVLPSYWEGMPTVILEAMASGVPVISTGVGDIPLVIRNKETGLLIEHTLESFESAIDFVINNRKHVANITQKARKLIETNFSLSNVNNIVGNVYSRMMS